MIEHPEPMKSGLSEAGRARKERMLGELQGAMTRRVARRRAARRVGSAAAFALAGAAVVLAMRGPSVAPIPTGPVASSNAGGGMKDWMETAEAPVAMSMPRLMHVELVSAPTRGSAVVRGTDPALVAKYVAARVAKASAAVVSDEELMKALAQTGNDYGLVRVGETVRVKCYSCEKGPDDRPPDVLERGTDAPAWMH